MSPTTIMAAASGSGSVSGMALPGGFAACGCAADFRSSTLKQLGIPEKLRVFGDVLGGMARKNLFFSPPARQRLLSIDGCALFGETVGSNTA
jgi:hypothetical protein